MTEKTSKCVSPGADGFAGFDEAFEAVKARVDRALTGAPRLIRGYTAHLAGARGKMLRAASLLACAQGPDGRVPEDAAAFAAAVELLHLATLVHDDVIDDAGTRRGIPTLHRSYGRRTAVICGDWLLTLALRTAADVPDRERYLEVNLPDYMGRVCLGELEQETNCRNFGLSVYRYLRIIGGKTAALFEAACFAGAVLCTGDERERGRYARFGRNVGMIFQLTDDCIDFEADARTAKKPVQSDYEQGVVTLPLIHTFALEPELRARAEAGTLGRDELSGRVRACGGLEYTRRLSGRYYSRAARLLGELGAAQEKTGRLGEILEKAYRGLGRPAAKA